MDTIKSTKKTLSTLSPAITALLLSLLLALPARLAAQGTPDYSGLYFIAPLGNAAITPPMIYDVSYPDNPNNFYLCPTEDWCYYNATDSYTDSYNGQPFLTTFRCKTNDYHGGNAITAVWTVEKHPSISNCYYIIQTSTGKYLMSNGQIATTSDANRIRVHLESVADPSTLDDKALFEIIAHDDHMDILPHAAAGRNGNNMYLVVNNSNRNTLVGENSKTGGPTGFENTGGTIGLYTRDDSGNGKWFLEPATVDPPTITNNYDGTVTITSETGATIYYTDDGTTPTTATPTTGTTSVVITLTSSITTIQAIAQGSGDYYPSKLSSYDLPQCTPPVVSFDHTTLLATITTEHTAYYTIDDTDPTTTSNPYSEAISVTSPTTLKAIATRAGYLPSTVTVLSIGQVATPTIQYNGSYAVAITSATDGATIYYTDDGTTPTTTSTLYSSPLSEDVSGVPLMAIAVKEGMIPSAVASATVTLPCAPPVISRHGNTGFTITCNFPPSGVSIYYTTDGTTPTTSSTSSTLYTGSPVAATLPVTVKAIATAISYDASEVVTTTIIEDLSGSGTPADPFTITCQDDVHLFIQKANTAAFADKHYLVTATTPLDFSGASPVTEAFSGTFDGNLCTLTGLTHALFNTVSGGTVRNVMLQSVNISASGPVGAICNTADGSARIYNCGVLPTDPNFESTSSIGSSDDYCGSIVGRLDGTARVINCFSFATITNGSTVAGIVGYNNTSEATQDNYTEKTIVMNCLFYGDITGGTTKYPVYGGNVIANNGTRAINNYNYYRGDATFDDNYSSVDDFNRSWPAEERNLRRFEYYRSILNSNRSLCAFWITGNNYASQTAADTALVAKWVLDRSIAPYPVLKRWGRYPSIINPDPTKVWDTVNNVWVQRTDAAPYQGKKLGTLSVTVSTGAHPGTLSGLSATSTTLPLTITDMDTLNYDYGYAKVQLPYYNEVFGDPTSNIHLTRYYGNYTDKVVTGWKITAVTDDGRERNAFVANWESGYNYADRNCTDKDIYDANANRAFAQGGYYYVPEGVTAISIEAYWGTAFYLHGKNHSVDHVNVTNSKNYGNDFEPAGTMPTTWVYNEQTIYDDLTSLMTEVKKNKTCNVYDQAVVLVGNCPLHAQNDINLGNSGQGGFTLMSADLDMDNEPDFILPLQWRNNTDRRPLMPVRFDFLPMPELGIVMRHNTFAYAIGIFVPQGHFEITETAFMHTTQFEYMSGNKDVNINHQQPLILNGGQFEQIVSHGNASTPVTNAKTRNIILGGHVWMKRFTPGSHSGQYSYTRHCAVSVMGGEYPEFYLTGLYWTGVTTDKAYDDNPHCYTNGGRFGIMAGACMEAVKNSVYFEIDHSVINEFYGGGINVNNPVAGNINVTINNSLVLDKYCGGPKVGTSQTVTTNASGTIFNQYFGGGNGGTNLYRETIKDDTPTDMPSESSWSGSSYGWSGFSPISTQGTTVGYNASYGYHAEFEFEVFNQSNGINANAVARTYRHWAQFGTTQTGNVTNTLTGCTVKQSFYGGGNLGNVAGSVTSTLADCIVEKDAFGAGFSASIPHFPVHDKSKVSFPYRDAAGVCHNGSVGYRTDPDNDTVIQYTWCYRNASDEVFPEGVVIPSGVTTAKPVFKYNNKWYVYTTVSLEGLGAVSGAASLTLQGTTIVGTEGDATTGNVYGGGDESAVDGNATVLLQDGVTIRGSVFGGGNQGPVGGTTSVAIQ